jgi:hypothetical protein
VVTGQITTGIPYKKIAIRVPLQSHLHGTCPVQVKLTLRLTKHDSTKHETVDVEFHLFLTSELEVIGHLHAPAAVPPTKEPMLPTEEGLGRPQAGLGVFGKKKSLAPLVNRTRFHIRPTRSIVIMPTEVFRLIYMAKEAMNVEYHKKQA